MLKFLRSLHGCPGHSNAVMVTVEVRAFDQPALSKQKGSRGVLLLSHLLNLHAQLNLVLQYCG